MADTKNFGLKGIGDNVQLGKQGSRIKTNGAVIEARDAADASLVNISAADPVNPSDLVTLSYFETNAANYANTLQAPSDGSYGGAINDWIIGTTTYSTALDNLNTVLGKLVPTAPPNLSSFSIAATGGSNSLLASGATDNTSGSIPSAGSTVYTIFNPSIVSTQANGGSGATGTDVEGTNGNLFTDGDTGTLAVILNGATDISHTLTTASDVGQYGSLDILSDVSYPASTPGFYKALKAKINKTSGVSVGYNEAYLSDSVSGNTNTISWVYDDIGSAPSLSSTAYSLNTSTGKYSSGIKHLTDGDTLNVAGTVSNLVGQTYSTGTVVDYSTYPSVGTLLMNATQLGTGLTFPLAANLAAQTITGKTLAISSTANFTTSVVEVQAYNTYGSSSRNVVTGDTLQVFTSALKTDDTPYETRIKGSTANGYRYYLGSTFTGDTPSGTLASPTATNWVSTQDLSATGYTHEATIVSGHIKNDVTNYTTGFIPVGLDYSTKDASQYITFVFNQATLSSFSMSITGSYAGLWIALPGVSDNNTISPNALGGNWWNAFALYNGSGVPGRSGDTTAGCATGSVASGSTGTVSVSFGTESSSNSTNNAVIVRFKLNAGQSISALSFSNTP